MPHAASSGKPSCPRPCAQPGRRAAVRPARFRAASSAAPPRTTSGRRTTCAAAEEDARRQAAEKVRQHKLEMKVSDAEWQWDRSKLTLFFTAEKRVDFRALVRDLAALFRTRIELRQIGVRDEAARLGGVGRCGREYCCSTWLSELSPVSLALAKDQHLSLNPAQISGGCGRLLCCLKYEHEFYVAARKRFPREGKSGGDRAAARRRWSRSTSSGSGSSCGTTIRPADHPAGATCRRRWRRRDGRWAPCPRAASACAGLPAGPPRPADSSDRAPEPRADSPAPRAAPRPASKRRSAPSRRAAAPLHRRAARPPAPADSRGAPSRMPSDRPEAAAAGAGRGGRGGPGGGPPPPLRTPEA